MMSAQLDYITIKWHLFSKVMIDLFFFKSIYKKYQDPHVSGVTFLNRRYYKTSAVIFIVVTE